MGTARFEYATYNGMPAARFHAESGPGWVAVFEIHEGRVNGLYGIRNPDKLQRPDIVRALGRGGSKWKP
ncbi:hypothetical protein [Amycolatopsis jiangsuensis]|uniref:Uncharacterized protein n=1 Tax=Amycolatopsis jiangsuensis TaxID=1181879 RepID=A0A840J5L0_9PSEU|nr:hypothetical protein [Amycolatopsis jiangsuensis]MBB4688684.1 hypothetical protein [Amycolatopsis jiangsuensis]